MISQQSAVIKLASSLLAKISSRLLFPGFLPPERAPLACTAHRPQPCRPQSVGRPALLSWCPRGEARALAPPALGDSSPFPPPPTASPPTTPQGVQEAEESVDPCRKQFTHTHWLESSGCVLRAVLSYLKVKEMGKHSLEPVADVLRGFFPAVSRDLLRFALLLG